MARVHDIKAQMDLSDGIPGTAVSVSHTGKVRKENQDRCLIRKISIRNDTALLLAVADGMGGPAGGAQAAEMVITSLKNFNGDSIEQVFDNFIAAIHRADQAIHIIGRDFPEFKGMGTTVTAALVCHDVVYWAHVGDSRLYHFTETLHQITDDHNQAGFLYRTGRIPKNRVFGHPLSNLLYRCLSGEGDELDQGKFPLNPGDHLIICSDGLHGVIRESLWIPLLTRGPDLWFVAYGLRDMAIEAGAPDNITVIIYRHGR